MTDYTLEKLNINVIRSELNLVNLNMYVVIKEDYFISNKTYCLEDGI